MQYLIKYFEEKEQIINEAEKITEGEVDHKITGEFNILQIEIKRYN